MVVLFDYDSMVYKAFWKIVSIAKIKSWIRRKKSREWMENEIKNLIINRLHNMANNIFLEIEETGIEIGEIRYFLTDCKKSFRKSLDVEYKANRKPNKWVNMVRRYLIEIEFSETSEYFEADDLIKDAALTLKENEFIILSVDKDLKQIAGLHFDYFGEKVELKNGQISKVSRGLEVITKQEANLYFWTQMLVGDTSDNIKGIKGIGPVKAKKALKDNENIEETVIEFYKNQHGEDWEIFFNKNYQLLKLGSRILLNT